MATRRFRENPEMYPKKRLRVEIASTISQQLFLENVEHWFGAAPREATRRAHRGAFLLQLPSIF